ncbi:MAG: hypothetical protein O7D91_06570, partial [Planctomycetota bacterium]|nr:hypothetical protein [Planctomycetota bacterium]
PAPSCPRGAPTPHNPSAGVLAKHPAHEVAVGDWKLVHLTSPTTCHCVLSRLDDATELPAVMQQLAPQSFGADGMDADANHDRHHAHGG